MGQIDAVWPSGEILAKMELAFDTAKELIRYPDIIPWECACYGQMLLRRVRALESELNRLDPVALERIADPVAKCAFCKDKGYIETTIGSHTFTDRCPHHDD